MLRGQWWKIEVFLALEALSAFLFALALFVFPELSEGCFAAVVVGAAVLSVGGFAWLVISVRCAACGTHLVWHAVTGQAHGDWLKWLASGPACPVCGHEK